MRSAPSGGVPCELTNVKESSEMSKPQWIRARAANQPSARKKRSYDEGNTVAAAVILADPRKHSDFQVNWARAFRRRQEQEGREVRS